MLPSSMRVMRKPDSSDLTPTPLLKERGLIASSFPLSFRRGGQGVRCHSIRLGFRVRIRSASSLLKGETAMRKIFGSIAVLALALALALAALPVLAQDTKPTEEKAKPTTPPGTRESILFQIDQAREKLISLAEAMPAEKYAWRPGEGVRSVGEVYNHV